MNLPAARRGRGTSAGLSREVVVAAAERLVERVGVERASLRAVAVELDVTPGALYNHVANKQELVDAVADAFLTREVLTRLPRDASPLDLVRLICRRLHAAGRTHPALLSAVVGHISERTESAQIEIAERLIGALRAAGAERERAHLLYRTLVALCLGNALYDSNLDSQRTTDLAARLERHGRSTTYPEVAAYVSRMPLTGSPDWFDAELDVVLAELARIT